MKRATRVHKLRKDFLFLILQLLLSSSLKAFLFLNGPRFARLHAGLPAYVVAPVAVLKKKQGPYPLPRFKISPTIQERLRIWGSSKKKGRNQGYIDIT